MSDRLGPVQDHIQPLAGFSAFLKALPDVINSTFQVLELLLYRLTLLGLAAVGAYLLLFGHSHQ